MNANSHPNYRGYDAIVGKVEALGLEPKAPKIDLPEITGPIAKMPEANHLHRQNAVRINRARKWCVKNGYRIYLSPHPYQLAKIAGPRFVIVLYQSSTAGHYTYVKPVVERADDDAIAGALVSELRTVLS